MRTYINEHTGAVISTPCEIHAEGWREETPAIPAPEKKPKRRAKRDDRKLCDDRGSADAVEAAD